MRNVLFGLLAIVAGVVIVFGLFSGITDTASFESPVTGDQVNNPTFVDYIDGIGYLQGVWPNVVAFGTIALLGLVALLGVFALLVLGMRSRGIAITAQVVAIVTCVVAVVVGIAGIIDIRNVSEAVDQLKESMDLPAINIGVSLAPMVLIGAGVFLGLVGLVAVIFGRVQEA